MTSIVVAYASNGVIGKANDLPWYIAEDLKRFKQLTSGNTVIMGRKTYQSIYGRIGGPLPNRRNIVISGSLDKIAGIEVVDSLEAATKLAKDDVQVFIIGGQRVFEEALKKGAVDRIIATEIKKVIDGDVFFPKLPAGSFEETGRESHSNDGYDYDVVIMERKNG